jgi:hypothetical protein
MMRDYELGESNQRIAYVTKVGDPQKVACVFFIFRGCLGITKLS